MPQPLLGEYVGAGVGVDNRDGIIRDLRQRVNELEDELMEANQQAQQLERDNTLMRNAMHVLRQQLEPFRCVIAAIFGEMSVIPVSEAVPVPAGNPSIDPRQRAIWDHWKKKIGGKSADAIEALLLHGEMTPQGVAVAIGIHPNNVAKVMYRLNQAGILRKNGRNYALKTQ